MDNSGFVHLHLHTEYSLLDGAIRINELGKRLKELGMDSCAITDHGTMYGVVSFYKAMKAEGIHPIIGCEVYVAPESRFKKAEQKERAYHHLVLLAKNNTGLVNLNRLVSAGFTEGFYKRPRVDEELLEKWHEGLICLSACVSGKLPCLIREGKMNDALKTAMWYDNLFGRGNYYLEIQANTTPEQAMVNAALVKMSAETGIPLVATNDCHYLNKEDASVHDVLLCMQTGAKVGDENRMRMSTDDFYVKSETDMRRFFSAIPSAIENTVKIASMCQAEYDFSTIHLPIYDVPEGYSSHEEYITSLTMQGLKDRFTVTPPTGDVEEYLKRAKYELSVINSMGYTDYYLIVWDFIDYAKKHGVVVGPGRGSGAGSLVAYAIGITDIDPIKYGLVFERFLNSERVSMPDFDVDFSDEKRQIAIDYVTRKYGTDRVAQVITFGTMAAKSCVRDVTRVLDLPYALGDKIAKLIPTEPGITLSQAMERSPEFTALYEQDVEVKKVIDIAKRLEGLPRNSSTHAAGVIISGKPITDIAPLSVNDETPVVQFAKADIESVGLLKFDFLGLRTLTVLQNAVSMINSNYGKEIDLKRIPLDDANVYKMIGNGETTGVFQLESRGMTNFMKQLKPESLEDIIAGISLYRPGPMDQIPKYVKYKNNPEMITYDHPLLEPILKVTYGCTIYQEQVMQIVRDLAGFSMGQSDNIRRAMSKKKKSMMEKYRDLFINGGTDENGRVVDGAIKRGVPADTASKIFDDVAGFAGYAFNKSHAACYAVVGYWTAYLKYYYPTEFMAAMLNSFRFDLDKASWYITCCANMGIKVLPPDVNKSFAEFTTEGDKVIRIGLTVIKNVGEGQVKDIENDRANKGEYKDFEDFLVRCSKVGIKRNVVESMIWASALDCFGLSRSVMATTVRNELDKLSASTNQGIDGQLSLDELMGGGTISGAAPIRIYYDAAEVSEDEMLSYEKEFLGIYLTGHPLKRYTDVITELATFDVRELNEMRNASTLDMVDEDKEVVMAALVSDKKTRFTKAKTAMCVMNVEDMFGPYEAVMFGKVFENYNHMIEKGKAVILVGRRNIRNGESFSLMVDKVFAMPDDSNAKAVIMNDFVYKKALKPYNGNSYSKPVPNVATIKNNVIHDNKENERWVPESAPVSDPAANHSIRIKFNKRPDSKEFQCLLNFLVYFHGSCPVDIEFTVDHSVVRLDEVCNCSMDREVIEKLRKYAGEDNVTIV